jgi:hypothetical protein
MDRQRREGCTRCLMAMWLIGRPYRQRAPRRQESSAGAIAEFAGASEAGTDATHDISSASRWLALASRWFTHYISRWRHADRGRCGHIDHTSPGSRRQRSTAMALTEGGGRHLAGSSFQSKRGRLHLCPLVQGCWCSYRGNKQTIARGNALSGIQQRKRTREGVATIDGGSIAGCGDRSASGSGAAAKDADRRSE